MDSSVKAVPRKRLVVGWRQLARGIAENRARYRLPAPRVATK
jgi:hypothetical protein